MEKIILQHGEKCSKNFVLDRKISSLDDLMEVLNTSPSLFVRHRPYPSAFIRSWQIQSRMRVGKVSNDSTQDHK